LLHGLLARGNLQFAIDAFDMGSYRIRGEVEALSHLRDAQRTLKEAEDIQLALREVLVERLLLPLTRAKLALLALEKLGEYAGVWVRFHDRAHLGEQRLSLGSFTLRRQYRSERKQPDEGWPGAQRRKSPSGRNTSLQFDPGFGDLPAFRELLALFAGVRGRGFSELRSYGVPRTFSAVRVRYS
jgi:hypothetical protein